MGLWGKDVKDVRFATKFQQGISYCLLCRDLKTQFPLNKYECSVLPKADRKGGRESQEK